MEDSIQSSMKKEAPSSQKSLCSEESGWTMYFDDFLTAQNRNSSTSSFGYMGSSSSLISDAASCAEAAWKLSSHINVLSPGPTEKKCRELSLKKRRKRGALEDESLEDTASSPVNSPKVSDLKQLDMSPRKKEDDKNSFQEKEIVSGGCLELQTDERNEMDFVGKECTELKKRGLCLVPLSVFLNYPG